MIKVAISKGRIFNEALPLLKAADIVPAEDPETSRKLILDTNHDDIKLLIIRATDVPTYVQFGAADLGVAGKDVLMEHGGEGLYEPVDLKIAQCRLMTAGMVNAQPVAKGHGRRLRVATKYTRVAHSYFESRGQQVEVIKLYGSMELGPIVGLADLIVDVVDTGNTLKANGLAPIDHIADISSRLVVNKAAMKMKHEQISRIVEKIKAAVK